MNSKMLPHSHTDNGDINHISKHLERINDFNKVADTFSQLSDPTRLRIFWMLCHCEECVTDIAEMMNMSSPAISHHLRILKNCNLIDSSRDGKEVFYKASETPEVLLMHKMLEEVMEIMCPTDIENVDLSSDISSVEHRNNQFATIKEIHDYTLEHLDERITIEELARKFLMNPTTLKAEFKAVYGESIAAHTKEHRMEHAETLLASTDLSLAEIASRVGYESQSKFTAAFKDYYGELPSAFRKKHTN